MARVFFVRRSQIFAGILAVFQKNLAKHDGKKTDKRCADRCKTGSKAGFDSNRLTAHSLRHTAGTLALMNGASPEEVQQVFRHTSINTTMIYLHAFDRAKNESELKVADAIFENK